MSNGPIKQAIDLAATATTILVLFNAVVSIAKEDKMAPAAVRAATTTVAKDNSPRLVR